MNWHSVKDMLGREINVPKLPHRIISLVPSQTELLFDLGLNQEVVGITKFCVHPKNWHQSKTRVGGTKKLNIEAIKALEPDLIIANKEENTQSEIELLAKLFPVWISNIKTIDEALEMIVQIGLLTGKEQNAQSIKKEIEQSFTQIPKAPSLIRVAYFIWREPWMSVGNDTFIHDIMSRMGWLNVYAHQYRYPETSITELSNLKPDVIFLSSEPYPFKEQHISEIQQQLPTAKVKLVDGEVFSWYGSRMKYAAEYLLELSTKL